MYKIFTSIIVITFLTLQGIYAQKVYTKADVRALFKKSTKNLWINYLSGTLDGRYVVDMIIGSDGKECKGLYTLRESGHTFFFEGLDKDHSLKLAEFTVDDKNTGTIMGHYDGEKLDAHWQNIAKNRTALLSLSIVNSFDDFQMPIELPHHWIRDFSGQIDGKEVNFTIKRNNDDYNISYLRDSIFETHLLKGKGLSVEIFNIDFKDNLLSGKSLMVESSLPSRADIVFKDENGYSSTLGLSLYYKMDFEEYAYVDFHTMLLCEKPKIDHKKFDVWMQEEIYNFKEYSLKKHKKLKYGDLGISQKWIHQADCWFEIDLYTKEWISGTIYYQSSLQKEVEKRAFIYDLKLSKLINVEDFFNSKLDKILMLEKTIYQHIENEKSYKNLDIESFKYATMNNEGFRYTTDFCPIYGEKSILIPFASIEQNLKNKSLNKTLLAK